MGSALPPKQSYLEWPVERHCSRSASVFPACAGVVPRTLQFRKRFIGLPRMRGGGPFRQGATVLRKGSSPHTRGWSCNARKGKCPFGSLPRIRGGGPSSFSSSVLPLLSSPHTRGWSQFIQLPFQLYNVFPAYAGVVPSWSPCSNPFSCLPRIRGGGPRVAHASDLSSKSSPHTRGWSPLHHE